MQMRAYVEGHINVIMEEFSPVMYTSQVVNGINYIIKVSENSSYNIICRIFN